MIKKEKKLAKLRGRIVELGLTYEDVAKALGITKTSFTLKMNESNFWDHEIEKLVEFLGISSDRIDEFFSPHFTKNVKNYTLN